MPIHEVGEHDGRLFLFMPYLEGGSLADNIEAYRDDPRKAAGLVAPWSPTPSITPIVTASSIAT